MKKNFKRISAVFLAVIVLFSSLMFTASAYVEDENMVIHFTEEETLEFLEYEIANGEVTITDCSASKEYREFEFVVPDTIEGYPVTAVGAEAFQDCRSMIKCTLPDTVRTIGDKAFYSACELREFVANGVVEIGSKSFWYDNIETVNLPETLEKISADTFLLCLNIKSFNISADNEYFSVKDGVLFNKDMTELIAFPGLWDSTDDTYTVPETVTAIGDHAVENCQNNTVLKTIVLTNVKTIGFEAFAYCPATTITLNDGVESIGEAAFYGSGIEAMVLPNSVKSIGMEAFRWCENLMSANIPEGITRLEDYLFYFNSMEELYLPSTLTYLGVESAPTLCTKVYYNGTQEDWRKLQEYEKDAGFESSEIFFNDGTSHKHDFAWRTIKNPNCFETGYKEYGCPDCDIVYETEEIAQVDHIAERYWTVLKYPTTTSEGERGKYCILCDTLFKTEVVQKLGACVYNIRYDESYDTHNAFTMHVSGRAAMVQFIEPDGGTRTYSRTNNNVAIKSYDCNDQEVNDLSREVAYEEWVINTNLTPNVEIKVRAKYVNGNGYLWDNAMKTFTVELKKPGTNAELKMIDCPTSGAQGAFEVKVTTGPAAEGVRFVMPNGTTTTYVKSTATLLSSGLLEFTGKAWANNEGVNEIQVQIKVNRVWQTVKVISYNAS